MCLISFLLKQEPIKYIPIGNANAVCHAFDSDAKDGHDLVIGVSTGDGGFTSLIYYLSPFQIF